MKKGVKGIQMRRHAGKHKHSAGSSHPSFLKSSKTAIFALLLLAAAMVVYSFVNGASVSHSISEIPNGPGSGLDADLLWGQSGQAQSYGELLGNAIAKGLTDSGVTT